MPKCEYIGLWSQQGCDNDAILGDRFCHVHRIQGPGNEMSNRWGSGCLWVVAIIVVFTVCGVVVGG